VNASEFLLRELRRRRIAAGLTQDEFGERIHFSGTHVSAVETGARVPKQDYLAAADEALATDGLFTRLLKDLVVEDAAPPWLREWIEFEHDAETLRWFEPLVVPGLLQTERYARATLTGGRLTPEEVEQRVTSRLERQSILTRGRPPQFVAVIDETVLRRPAEEHPGLMREQLDRLISDAEQEHVQVHIVPAEAGIYLGLAGQFIIADLPDGTRVAHADNQLSAQIVNGVADVARLTRTWEIVRNKALPAANQWN
jgi:transcriptional regulator with XRE-family HTH domain